MKDRTRRGTVEGETSFLVAIIVLAVALVMAVIRINYQPKPSTAADTVDSKRPGELQSHVAPVRADMGAAVITAADVQWVATTRQPYTQ